MKDPSDIDLKADSPEGHSSYFLALFADGKIVHKQKIACDKL